MSNRNPTTDCPAAIARRRLVLGAGAAAAAAVGGPARAQAGAPEPDQARPAPAPGTALPLPRVELLDGTLFRPEIAEGRVTVVYWWASWCPFCAQQSPLMNKLWLDRRGQGLVFLGLSIDRKREDAAGYLARKGYTFPSGLVTSDVARVLPKPKGLPVTLVRGRDGKVLMAEAGQLFPEDVDEIARFL
jgi:thiol-disulfide isomerase/thioredoxin